MDVLTLTTALVDRGLSLRLIGEEIQVLGNAEALTPEIADGLRRHKATLLGCLAPAESDLAFADAPAAAKGLGECLAYFERFVGAVADAGSGRTILRWPTPLPTPCRACGGAEASIVAIHDGDSLRRDCARCGAFRDFPVWQDRAEAEEWLRAVADSVTIEAGRPADANDEATLTETP